MNDRLKFRVWDKISKRYFYLELKFGDNGYHPDFITDPVFEQCTGLKDKNGNLIYEGDLIKGTGRIKYQIMWKDARFVAVATKEFDYMPDNLLNQKWLDTCKLEIIGNIHKQPEQKD